MFHVELMRNTPPISERLEGCLKRARPRDGACVPAKDLQAVILCGGHGTRLRGVLGDVPKALAPIADRPFLDYVLEQLATSGIEEVLLCTGVGAEQLEKRYGSRFNRCASVAYSVESEPSGTAGALKIAAPFIRTNPFLMLNGDSFFDVDFNDLVYKHQAYGAIATLGLVQMKSVERYGVVKIGQHGEIEGFVEKAHFGEATTGTPILVNAGVYVLDGKLLDELPAPPPAASLEREILPALIGRGLYGVPREGYFIDIGVPEDYRRAQLELPKRSARGYSHSR